MNKFASKCIFLPALLGLLGAIALKRCLNLQEGALGYSNSIWSVFLWMAWSFAIRRAMTGVHREKINERWGSCFGFSLLFVGSMTAGVQLEQQGMVDFSDLWFYASTLVVAAALTPLVSWAVCALEAFSEGHVSVKNALGKKMSDRRFFLFVWGGLFVCYFVVLISVWPGFFSYDATDEVYMVFTDKYSAHHPMLHVLLLGWIVRLIHKLTGSYNVGIAAYIIVQMLVLSACFSYIFTFMRRSGVRRFIVNAGILFMALFPTVQMFVCCTTKDVYFSCGVALFTTLMTELVRDGEVFWSRRGKKRLLLFSMLLVLFFRNNGIYALVIFMLLFSVVNRKTWKKWLFIMVLPFLIFGVVTVGINAAFHVRKGETAEMLCVPMQQLARVYAQNRVSYDEEELEVLYSLIPATILENYNPKLADNIKVNFLEDNFKADPGKYISLWLKTGVENPEIYINSFLENTYGYWYPDTIPDGYRGRWITDREYADSSYFQFVTEMPGQRQHFFPVLESFYEKISLEIYQQKLPVVSMFFSIGFMHWVYAFILLYLWLTGHRKHMLILALTVLLYLTVLLGPIALVRYVLCLYFELPLACALLFDIKMLDSPVKIG